NNATIGGALIPLLSLGIPGDTVTAVLLGGFIIHGIQPGPLLMQSNPDIVNIIYIGFLLAIIIIFIVQFFGMRIFPQVLKIPNHYLFSIILVLAIVGAYVDNFLVFDLWVMLILGFIGLIFRRNNYPFAPMILGFVLGPIMEGYLRRGLIENENNFLLMI